jgi:hypothetical protein
MRKTIIAFLLALMPISLSAKEFTLSVFSPSDPAAPVTLRGTMTGDDDSPRMHEFSCSVHLSVTNVSSKPILLIIAEARAMIRADGIVRSTLDERGIDDYFFKPELFLPKSSRVLDIKMFPQKQDAKLGQDPSRKVSGDAHVLFVQFADGSTWGDLQIGRQFLEQRQQAWKELQVLAELYHSNNRQRFVAALKEPAAQGPYLGRLGLIYGQTKDVELVAREMQNLLDLGYARLHKMDQSTTGSPATRNR